MGIGPFDSESLVYTGAIDAPTKSGMLIEGEEIWVSALGHGSRLPLSLRWTLVQRLATESVFDLIRWSDVLDDKG